jgi:hypothetical protein
MCLKAAVYEITGDERRAELVLSAPVDEMCHAIIAQFNLCRQIEDDQGVRFNHMTDLERFGYEAGSYTERCYRACGWGQPDPRFWFDYQEHARRVRILDSRYRSIDIRDLCHEHDIDFEAGPLAA